LGEKNRSHAAAPELALEHIAVTQGLGERGRHIAHGDGSMEREPFESAGIAGLTLAQPVVATP
jgi:hypothetical protein